MPTPDDQIPKSFSAARRELKDGYFVFDKEAVGPFLLPLLNKLESLNVDAQTKDMTLVFRDAGQGKRYEVPITLSLVVDLYEKLEFYYRNFEKIGKKS